MKTTLLAMFISALFVMFLVTVMHAQGVNYVEGEILVGMKEGIDQDVIQAINAQVGAEILYKYSIINAYQLRLPPGLNVPAAIDFYNNQPAVEYADPNYIVYADVVPNDPDFSKLWGLHNTGQTGGTPDADIDAPEAWDITTGSEEIIVASIDTGVDYKHEDLAANMWINPGEDPIPNGVDDDGSPVGCFYQAMHRIFYRIAQVHAEYSARSRIEMKRHVFAEKNEAFSPGDVFESVNDVSNRSKGSHHEPPRAFLLL